MNRIGKFFSRLPLLAVSVLISPGAGQHNPPHCGHNPAAYVEKLKSTDPNERENAAEWLGALKDKNAIPDLEKGLFDPVPRVRKMCVQALGMIGDPSVAPVLLNLLFHQELDQAAQLALENLSPDWRSTPAARSLFARHVSLITRMYLERSREAYPVPALPPSEHKYGDGYNQSAPFEIVAAVDPPAAAWFFLDLIAQGCVPSHSGYFMTGHIQKQPRSDTVPRILAGIPRFRGDHWGAKALLDTLEAVAPSWRETADELHVAQALIENARKDPGGMSTAAFIALLQGLRNPVAVPLLLRIAGDEHNSDSDRVQALRALGEFDHPDARAFLLDMAESPVVGRKKAAMLALAKRPAVESLRIFGKAMALTPASPWEDARPAAIDALLDTLGEKAVDELVPLIKNPAVEQYVRLHAIQACGAKIRGARLDQALAPLLERETDSSVFLALLSAVGHSTASRLTPTEVLNRIHQEPWNEEAALSVILDVHGCQALDELMTIGRKDSHFAIALLTSASGFCADHCAARLPDLESLLTDILATLSGESRFLKDHATEAVVGALARAPSEKLRPFLETAEKHPNARVRANATHALYRLDLARPTTIGAEDQR